MGDGDVRSDLVSLSLDTTAELIRPSLPAQVEAPAPPNVAAYLREPPSVIVPTVDEEDEDAEVVDGESDDSDEDGIEQSRQQLQTTPVPLPLTSVATVLPAARANSPLPSATPPGPSPPPSPRPQPHPLQVLTSAVARELDVLPTGAASAASGVEDEREQPWVYPPAHADVSAMRVCVYDPDGLWVFLEGPLVDHVTRRSRSPEILRGVRRSVFTAHEILPSPAPETLTVSARHEAPYLHLGLVRCETLAEYQATTRSRIQAFVEDVRRRNDDEWLLVMVESHKDSRKVFDKVRVEFGRARCSTASVFDGRRRDAQWAELSRAVGDALSRAHAARVRRYKLAVRNLQDQELVVPGWNFCAYVAAVESLAFVHIQGEQWTEALEAYTHLVHKMAQLETKADPMVLKMIRASHPDANNPLRLRCCAILFPNAVAPSAATPRAAAADAATRAALPARILDVTRLPFRELIGTSAISSHQLQLYLLSRRLLLLLQMGRPTKALELCVGELPTLVHVLRRTYASSESAVDAWLLAASLELVAAGHACAAVNAFEVASHERVALCLAQATLLERSCEALERISRRELGSRVVPLMIDQPVLRLLKAESEVPPGVARALGSPEAFRALYTKLLQAAAAHSVGAGRFRFAARLTHRRARAEPDARDARLLFMDSSRWWSGGARAPVVDSDPEIMLDDWCVLRAETMLCECVERGLPPPLLLAPLCDVANTLAQLSATIHRRLLARALLSSFVNGERTDALPLMLKISTARKVERGASLKLRAELVLAPAFDATASAGKSGDGRRSVPPLAVDACGIRWELVTGSEDPASTAPGPTSLQHEFAQLSSDIIQEVAIVKKLDALEGRYRATRAWVTVAGKRVDVSLVATPAIVRVVRARYPVTLECRHPMLISTRCDCESRRSSASAQRVSIVVRPAFDGARECTGKLYVAIDGGSNGLLLSRDNEMLPDTTTQPPSVALDCVFARAKPDEDAIVTLAVTCQPSSPENSNETAIARLTVKCNVDGSDTAGRAILFRFELKIGAPIRAKHAAHVRGDSNNVVVSMRLSKTECVKSVIILELRLRDQHERVLEATGAQNVTKALPALLNTPNDRVYAAFVVEAPRGLLSERPGGRSLVPLRAEARLRLSDDSTCVVTWDVPVLLKRAGVVRTRWQPGAFSSKDPSTGSGVDLGLIPPLEAARVGDAWSDTEDDLERNEHPSILLD